MTKLFTGFLFILILAVLLTAGCGTAIGGSSNKNSTTKTTPTPSPTPTIGSAFISTSPIGASVYLENKYQGLSPLNLTNLPNGKYNLSLKLEGYAISNSTFEIKGGDNIKVSKSLAEAKAKIDITMTDSSVVKHSSQCFCTFIGNITNTGDVKIYGLKVTLEMTPASKLFDVVTKELNYGDVAPGIVRPFGFDMIVLCEGNYKAQWKWEGTDIKNPANMSDDKPVSGSIKF